MRYTRMQISWAASSMKNWLAIHNDAVMSVLFLVFGINLIAKGLPPLT